MTRRPRLVALGLALCPLGSDGLHASPSHAGLWQQRSHQSRPLCGRLLISVSFTEKSFHCVSVKWSLNPEHSKECFIFKMFLFYH